MIDSSAFATTIGGDRRGKTPLPVRGSRDEGASRHVLRPPVVRRTRSTPPPCGPARVSICTLLPRPRPLPARSSVCRLASLTAGTFLTPPSRPPRLRVSGLPRDIALVASCTSEAGYDWH